MARYQRRSVRLAARRATNTRRAAVLVKMATRKRSGGGSGNTTRMKNNAQQGLGFPKKQTVTLRYVESVTTSSVAGALGTLLFRCNDILKPNNVTTGHKALFYSLYTGIYDHWTVIGSKITWRLTPETTSANSSRVCVFINDDGTTTSTSLDAVAEQPYAKQMRYFAPGAQQVHTITQKWSARKAFGRGTLANNMLQGSLTTSPTELQMYQLFVQSDDGATIPFNVTVTIEYIVVFCELKEYTNT